ncbi:MAG TPA: DNA-binding domain-containing protein [Pirellulaceae bacterium]|nr:DNA-binding domain-containing protein [Pirellulaceae bacterium]
MNDAPEELQSLQAWLQAAITQPAGMNSADEQIAAQITASSRQTAYERLAIYHHAYLARLIDCLGAMFPALLATLEADAFAALAAAYLEQHPSKSYTLNHLADRFSDFLQASRPPRESNLPDAEDFLIELARLEQAIDQIFDGPGSEDTPPMELAALSRLTPEQLAECRIELTAGARLLASAFDVSGYYTQFRRGETLAPPRLVASWLLLYRREYIVRRLALSAAQFALLATLNSGGSVTAGIQAAWSKYSGTADEFQAELGAWFRDWAADGVLLRVVGPSSSPL